MESLGLDALVGRTVTAAWINDEHDMVVLDTSSGYLYLTWEGDCCAHCFLANVSGADALIGAKITAVESAEWVVERDDDDYDVMESMGTKIQTTRGHVSLESRVEHNGYYGGMILVSDADPLDQYREARYKSGEAPSLKPLTDF